MPPRAFPTTSPYAHGAPAAVIIRRRDMESDGGPLETEAKRRWTANWNRGFTRTVRCLHCPDWEFTGNGFEAEEAFAEHRLLNHYQESTP